MDKTEHYSGSFGQTSVETWDQGGVNLVSPLSLPPPLIPSPPNNHRCHLCNVQVLSLPLGSTLELRTGDVTDSISKVTFCVTLVHADF